MYIVTFTAHQQRNMVRTPHFFGAGDATGCSYSHRTDWGLRSFAVAGPSSWNALPVGLRSSSFGLDTFAKHLKTHLLGLVYSRQGTHF